MCNDLCLRQLGDRCLGGSWCENGYACHALFWASPERSRIYMNSAVTDYTDHLPVLCQEALQFVLPPSEIDIISTRRLIPEDTRPYVRIEYLEQSLGVAFVALLDTGSTYSLVPLLGELNFASAHAAAFDSNSFDPSPLITVRPARTRQRYIDRGLAPLVHESLEMNFGGDHTEACRIIRESARLHSLLNSTFSFDLDIVLTRDSQPYHFLLAAGKDSDFVRSAQQFAITSDRLVVGNVDAFTNVCGNSTVFWSQSEPNDWIIRGYISAISSHPVRLVVDTGASLDRVEVDRNVYQEINNRIIDLGGIAEGRRAGRYSNCTSDFPNRVPTISYRLGESPESPSIQILPTTYLSVSNNNSSCELILDVADDLIITISSKMLRERSLTTLFDHANDRLGFCLLD